MMLFMVRQLPTAVLNCFMHLFSVHLLVHLHLVIKVHNVCEESYLILSSKSGLH